MTRTVEFICSTDKPVRQALERAHDLAGRAQAASLAATAASEQVAAAARAHAEQRAQALADGLADPGPFDPHELQAVADEASGVSAALARAHDIASANAHELADEREAAWAVAARKRLDKERGALLALIEQWEQALPDYVDAWVELQYAIGGHATRERKVGKIGASLLAQRPSTDELRGFVAVEPVSRPVTQVPDAASA
jgi:hypothetical protein